MLTTRQTGASPAAPAQAATARGRDVPRPRWPGILIGIVVGGLLAGCQTAQKNEARTTAAAPGGGTSAKDGGTKTAPAKDAAADSGNEEEYRNQMRLGKFQLSNERFAAAERSFVLAAQALPLSAPEADPRRLDVLSNLAITLSSQRRLAEADALFRRVAANLDAGTIDVGQKLMALTTLAAHFANREDFSSAQNFAEQAWTEGSNAVEALNLKPETAGQQAPAALGRSFGAQRDIDVLSGQQQGLYANVAQSALMEAVALRRLGKPKQALERIDRGLAIVTSDRTAPAWWEASFRIEKAQNLTADSERDGAITELRRAIDQLKGVSPDGSRREGRAHLILGANLKAGGQKDQALGEFRTGMAQIAATGGGLSIDLVLPYFQLLLERQGAGNADAKRELLEAAIVLQKGAAAEAIEQLAVRWAASDPEAERATRALEEAKRRLSGLRQEFVLSEGDKSTSTSELASIRKEMVAISSEMAALEQQVQERFPQYNQLLEQSTKADEVLAVLKPDEAVFQVLVGDRSGVALFVRKDRITAYELDFGDSTPGELVRRLRQHLSGNQLLDYDLATANRLFNILFGQARQDLQGVGHVIVVPSGPLLSLPFGMLVTEPAPAVSNQDYRSVKWLGQSVALSISPSVRSFVDLRAKARPSRATQAFIGFGDPTPAGDPGLILNRRGWNAEACGPTANAIANARPLQGVREELSQLAAILGGGAGNIVLQDNFTAAKLRELGKSDLERYRVVYFSTHGFLPGNMPCLPEPGLLVSRPTSAASGDDVMMMASEIVASLRFDADLIVLAACDTGGGGGDQFGGEGLSGMARAFFLTGARSLLVAHWPVSSRSTIALMHAVFGQLAADHQLDIAEAMRRAQVQMINSGPEFSHPFFWAAFTLVGEGNKIVAPVTTALGNTRGSVN
ncbi:MAG: CHAT domain-containing protein [Azospirillum sp.]|nr:CHAT domain-containing protein [Azospirillum sp.]